MSYPKKIWLSYDRFGAVDRVVHSQNFKELWESKGYAIEGPFIDVASLLEDYEVIHRRQHLSNEEKLVRKRIETEVLK